MLSSLFAVPIFGNIQVPAPVGAFGVSSGPGFVVFMNSIVAAVFATSGLLFFFYLLFGGFKYLMAGGDDKAVQAAKKMITNAGVGLAIVVFSYFIADIVSVVFGIEILLPKFG